MVIQVEATFGILHNCLALQQDPPFIEDRKGNHSWSDIVRGKKTFSKDLEAKILRLDGVEKRSSRWGHKVAYWTGGREFAHFQDEKVIDIRITRKEEIRMRKTDHSSRVVFRPRTSDWIKLELRARRDVDEAFNLVKIALMNNRMDGLHKRLQPQQDSVYQPLP